MAYLYLIVREDLSLEHQTVQAAHAALESGYRFPRLDDETFLVVLGVPDEEALLAAHERITRKGVKSYLFFEPDHAMGYTALASEPLLRSQNRLRKVFYPYSLLGKVVQVESAAETPRTETADAGSCPALPTIAPLAQR